MELFGKAGCESTDVVFPSLAAYSAAPQITPKPLAVSPIDPLVVSPASFFVVFRKRVASFHPADLGDNAAAFLSVITFLLQDSSVPVPNHSPI